MAANRNGDGTNSDTPTLSEVDILHQEIQQMREQQAQDGDKIKLIRTYLMGDTGDEYDTRVAELGPFTTYAGLEEWLKSHYATPDAINTYCDRFFGCQQ